MTKRTIVADFLNKTTGAGVYDRYPDISDRDRWESLSDELKKDIEEAGKEAAKEPWTQLLISDFTQFSKTGNRLRFEDKYFPRRRKLSDLVIAECVENKGRFIDDILDGLYLILEESSWCLPAHNTYVRDAVQEYLPDVKRPVIDLFDAETGAFIAMTEYLLRPVFDKISPYISKYVDDRLTERIFTPYNTFHFWWMGNGKENMCNWTPWCTQNVLICALTRRTDFFSEQERRHFLEKAAVSLDYFLDEYGDDGCCNEGAQYYSHAGLCLFGALELMDGALRDEWFSRVFGDELIRNIGNYIVKMHVAEGRFINFADCSMMCGRRGAREYLYGKAAKDRALTGFAAEDFRRGDKSERLLRGEINLFYHVLQVFHYDEMMNYSADVACAEDFFFESTGLMTARDEHFTLAAKAGNNADSHNHNDVGSFTVFRNGLPMVIDLGAPTYTRETFSDRRYEIWTMQSQFHNLPTFMESNDWQSLGIDPAKEASDSRIVMQKDGADYRAEEVSCTMNESICTISMDIAGAYNDSRIRHYYREITLNKESAIVVSDDYDGDLPAAVTLMLAGKPVITKDARIVLDLPDQGRITAFGAAKALISEFPITDKRLMESWKGSVYRVLLVLEKNKKLKLVIDPGSYE